jgi:glycosyltransferase involved in cell wall biosynthesis
MKFKSDNDTMKKKCLIIIPGIPYPPVDGHKLKIYNLILILCKYYDLHIITIAKENISKEQAEFINNHSYRREHFRLTILGTFFRLIQSIFSKIPFQVKYYTLPSVKNYIVKNSEEDEFAVLNLIRTCEYIDILRDKYLILDMVDCLSKSYLKSNETTTSLIYSFIYKIEGNRLVEYEKKCVQKVNLTLCVNKEDAGNLSRYGNVEWLPNGVNKKLFNYTKKNKKYSNYIVFFGAMFYQPNIDAVIWFERYVLDYLNPDIKLIIIGARPALSLVNISKKRKNVEVTGFLEDPYLIINSCFAVIAPMQNGGGIQNKILETMGMGKVNILTSYAADPIIGAKNEEHFIVENNPIVMAEKINEIYLFPERYITMKENAASFIKNNYTWDAYEEKIISKLKN